MSASNPSSPMSSPLDMKTNNRREAALAAVAEGQHRSPQQMQKIKKCALKSKTNNATFCKLTHKCAKNLNQTKAITSARTQSSNNSAITITNCKRSQRILSKNLNKQCNSSSSYQNNNNKCAIHTRSVNSNSNRALDSSKLEPNSNRHSKFLIPPLPLGKLIATTTASQTTTTTSANTHSMKALKAIKSKLIKAKVEPQLLHHTTKENFLLTLDLFAVVRRNASDKLKLIQMVHDNPILWDSRLPNFKGAEEEKNSAWEQIGREFNAPGRRVARAFKSLRESYRRELAHVKLMGNGFKPKWSLYDAMDFLRDVIRERKGGSHAAEHSSLGLNLSAFAQHLSANSTHIHNNNNSSNNNNNNNSKSHAAYAAALNNSVLNLSKSTLNLSHNSDEYYYGIKSEMDLSNQSHHGGLPPPAAHQHHNGGSSIVTAAAAAAAVAAAAAAAAQASSNMQHHDTRVSSTRSESNQQQNHNQNNAYDDIDASSLRSGAEGGGDAEGDEEEEASSSLRNGASGGGSGRTMSHHGSEGVEELDAIDADFPYPLILDSTNSPTSGVGAGSAARAAVLKRRRKNGDDADDDDELMDDDNEEGYDEQMQQQHRHLRLQQQQQQAMGDMPPPQTVREVLNSKFCGFISAKLNSMEDSEADNLMNKILMLLVQTQGNSFEAK